MLVSIAYNYAFIEYMTQLQGYYYLINMLVMASCVRHF